MRSERSKKGLEIAVAAAFGWIAVAGPAIAQDQGPGAPRTPRSITDEVADLERKVDDLTILLQAIVKADAARAKEIEAALERISKKTAPPKPPTQPSTEPPPTQPPARPPPTQPPTKPPPETPIAGTISGNVRGSDGSAVKAWVYVENVPGRMAQGKVADMRQIDKQFSPRYLVVQKGTRVRFPNQDSIYHNVFSHSKGNEFDLGSFRRGDPQNGVAFSTPGVVEVYCGIHSNMHATIVVVPSGLFVQVDAEGAFQLVGVPQGPRRIVAVGLGLEPEAITVNVDQRPKAGLMFKMRAAKPQAQHYDYAGSVGVQK
jgi:plastocyanin